MYIKNNILLALAYHPKDPDISQCLNYVTSLLTATERDSTPRNEEG